MRAQFEARLGELRGGAAYRNYVEVRDRVWTMLDEAEERSGRTATARPSDYWQEELEGFDYMLDAGPLVIAKLREHCYHLTGLRSYEYRRHHDHKAAPFAGKLQMLRELDSSGLFIPEADALGGYGHRVDGQLVNLDTLKFYESLIALDRGGVLGEFRADDGPRRLALEIGAGWGGFGYQFKKVCPNTTYVIVDLPATLLFSATYLRTLFPEAKCWMWGPSAAELATRATRYDFVFLPHYAFDEIELDRVDLAINMVSFQEMTTEQVEGYVARLDQIGCPTLYSHNRDRSAHNTQLTAVGTILKRRFQLQELHLLDIPYTNLVAPTIAKFAWPRTKNPKRFLHESLKSYLRASQKSIKKHSLLHYRHLIARTKAAAVEETARATP